MMLLSLLSSFSLLVTLASALCVPPPESFSSASIFNTTVIPSLTGTSIASTTTTSTSTSVTSTTSRSMGNPTTANVSTTAMPSPTRTSQSTASTSRPGTTTPPEQIWTCSPTETTTAPPNPSAASDLNPQCQGKADGYYCNAGSAKVMQCVLGTTFEISDCSAIKQVCMLQSNGQPYCVSK
ncbi:hypothetical protein GGS21DRAFT_492790 [Xylaria nigripes]|nr:hypothetical protein GGS21DRAFT_492790 [Xylaria nigripes]